MIKRIVVNTMTFQLLTSKKSHAATTHIGVKTMNPTLSRRKQYTNEIITAKSNFPRDVPFEIGPSDGWGSSSALPMKVPRVRRRPITRSTEVVNMGKTVSGLPILPTSLGIK